MKPKHGQSKNDIRRVQGKCKRIYSAGSGKRFGR